MSSINTLSEVPTRVDELPPDLLAMRTSNAEKGVNILAQTPSRPFSYREDETVYAKFTPKRKILITAIVSFGGLGVNLAALLVLSALPEVAAAFHTTGTIINYSNALFLLIMGIGVLFWGPISQVYGRKWVSTIITVPRTSCTIVVSTIGFLATLAVAQFLHRSVELNVSGFCHLDSVVLHILSRNCEGPQPRSFLYLPLHHRVRRHLLPSRRLKLLKRRVSTD